MAPPTRSTHALSASRSASVSAGCAELFEDRVEGAIATDVLSGLIICGAAGGAAGFGVSGGSGAELVEACAGGAVAIGGLSGLTFCGAADGAAVFGV